MSRTPGGSLQALGSSALAAMVLATLIVLLSSADQQVRADVSSAALAFAGLGGALLAGFAARRAAGLRRLGWSLIGLAAVVAIGGSLLIGPSGSSVVPSEYSAASDVAVALALTLTVVGAICLPRNRWHGPAMRTLVLDGVLVVTATLVIASSLVYDDLLAATSDGLLARTSTLAIPVLDVLLGTVAVVLFVRSRGADRWVMALIAVGSVSYALTDLRYALLIAQDEFVLGTWPDIGWIAGYAALAAGAVIDSGGGGEEGDAAGARGAGVDLAGTAAVFAMLLAAGAVQILVPVDDGIRNAQALLWLLLILTAAVRQVTLSRENDVLRRGLERRVAEQTADLRRMVHQTTVLVDSVGDGIYGVDARGRVTFMNRVGRSLLGLTSLDRIADQHVHDVFHAPRRDGVSFPRSGCYVTGAIERGELVVAEEDEYVRVDGTLLPVEITASPLTEDAAAGREGAVVVFRDATQRREMDRIKEEFLSVVSHELRTPLTSIRGSLGLLSGGALGALPEAAARVARLAEESSQRLARMINDMLDLERLATGQVVLEIERVPADELLATVVAELSGLSELHGVPVVVGERDGEALVDVDRFVQVMTNLIGNAMKFSAPGQPVRVEASRVGDELLVEVRDSGRGIPAEQLERVFDRFHQVDSSDSRQKGGTGLGLAISRELIERMGGRIWAESTVGVGTSFWFALPSSTASDDRPTGGPDLRHTSEGTTRATT